MIEKLKPCPFCGNTPAVLNVYAPIYSQIHTKPFAVFCSGCDTWHGYDEAYGGEFDTEDEAVSSWNRRATDEQVQP